MLLNYSVNFWKCISNELIFFFLFLILLTLKSQCRIILTQFSFFIKQVKCKLDNNKLSRQLKLQNPSRKYTFCLTWIKFPAVLVLNDTTKTDFQIFCHILNQMKTSFDLVSTNIIAFYIVLYICNSVREKFHSQRRYS